MIELYLDTHFQDVLIALYKDGKLFDLKKEKNVKNTSVVTLPLFIEMLNHNNLNVNDIKKIYVNIGPGSFTGVRIGVTLAKTIAYSLNIPIVGVSSLDILVAMLDTESYVAVKENNGYFVALSTNVLGRTNIDYLNETEYVHFIKNRNVYINYEDIDYQKAYNYFKKFNDDNYFTIKPFYVKSIEAMNDKRN